jgi:16S rRNA (uracil1498-N3)-methyltransferase
MARRVRVYLGELAEGRRALPREASHYLCGVHRLSEGAIFVAFDPELAVEAEGRISRVTRGEVECELGPAEPARRGGCGVRLLQATAKGDRIEQVVRAATALGAEAISLVVTERSVAVPGQLRWERLRTIAIDAARQSGRGDLPSIAAPRPLEDVLTEVARTEGLRVCLSPRASRPLVEIVQRWTPGSAALVLIGPEGGLSDGELELARAAGFTNAALGPLTLRTELAATAALACFTGRLPSSEETV